MVEMRTVMPAPLILMGSPSKAYVAPDSRSHVSSPGADGGAGVTGGSGGRQGGSGDGGGLPGSGGSIGLGGRCGGGGSDGDGSVGGVGEAGGGGALGGGVCSGGCGGGAMLTAAMAARTCESGHDVVALVMREENITEVGKQRIRVIDVCGGQRQKPPDHPGGPIQEVAAAHVRE